MIAAKAFGLLNVAVVALLTAVPSSHAGELYFRSNFESPISIINRLPADRPWARDLIGQDGTLANKDHWQTDLEHDSNSAVGIDGSWLGNSFINVINDTTQNRPRLVPDPTNSANQVLKFEVFDTSETFAEPPVTRAASSWKSTTTGNGASSGMK